MHNTIPSEEEAVRGAAFIQATDAADSNYISVDAWQNRIEVAQAWVDRGNRPIDMIYPTVNEDGDIHFALSPDFVDFLLDYAQIHF